MRKIIAGLFITLDGVVEAPGRSDTTLVEKRGWSEPYMNQEIGMSILDQMRVCNRDGWGVLGNEATKSLLDIAWVKRWKYPLASVQIPCLARICSHERFWPASSYGQWLVRLSCLSKGPGVQIERYSNFANPGSDAGANRATVPKQNVPDFVGNDDRVIVSRGHISSCCHRVAKFR